MTILCGIDFTEPGREALATAAILAERMREPLRVAHVMDLPGADEILREPSAGAPTRVRKHVEAEYEALGERLRAEVARVVSAQLAPDSIVLAGNPDEALVSEAERCGAKLVVVGALGRRSGSVWHLGSTADRVAQVASRPVLVVRRAERFGPWARGERALRVLVGVDATPASDAAVRWLESLRAAGPCTTIGAHVYWPPEQRERLQIRGGIPIGKDHPEVDAALTRELRARLDALPGGEKIELRLVGGLGRTADHLVQMAEEEKADLVVVGSHQRSGLDRLWHGSVSRGVIDGAPTSVLSVPSG